MHLNLPEKLEAFAQQQVGEGLYSSTSEYIRELIRKDMELKELRRREAFYAAVQVGDAQLLNGQGSTYTKHTMNDLRKQASALVKSGNSLPSSDALPL